MGLVERDNAQKMIRNDLGGETMGRRRWGISARVSPRACYSLRHNTYIFARTVGERGPRGGCRGVNIV